MTGRDGLIEYVENGTGNYAGAFGLSDRTEIGYEYDVQDGSTFSLLP